MLLRATAGLPHTLTLCLNLSILWPLFSALRSSTCLMHNSKTPLCPHFTRAIRSNYAISKTPSLGLIPRFIFCRIRADNCGVARRGPLSSNLAFHWDAHSISVDVSHVKKKQHRTPRLLSHACAGRGLGLYNTSVNMLLPPRRPWSNMKQHCD